ncbi:ExbD/TolR family protein [Sulfuriroseicoccus oceanibius]|uniref:Biopolymer transporter ExbD n=1 Tax=Sulfuriroseicoccus oceanibius TaxID=2707525 RepID=A0A6B3L9T0_9BACT|nr:biopolymer transporter ExbD [Sulfuriroseicoccus oceanibius]QQL44323.1 biopolymer transporter ExbD [Sulfuriroseicoccus oceanibius]
MKFNRRSLDNTGGMQLAPMIDIVFLLLIFFIVTWSYARFETELDVQVPVAKEGESSNRQVGEIIINVRKNGDVVLNGNVMSREELLERVSKIAVGYKDVAVILRGDEDTKYKDIIGVVDTCRSVGIWNVAFATQQPEQ